MIGKNAQGQWTPISNATSPDQPYKHDGWPTLKIRILKPFYWRPEIERNGVRVGLDATRVVAPGEIIDALQPDALTYCAQGRAEFIVDVG